MNRICADNFCGDWIPLRPENVERFKRGFTEEQNAKYAQKPTDDIFQKKYSLGMQMMINERYRVSYEVLDFSYAYSERVKRHHVPHVHDIVRMTGLKYS